MPENTHLTQRQANWFQSVRDGLEIASGRSIAQWAAIARACPEGTHRKRFAWMKANHALGLNQAGIVLNAAFPPADEWSRPDNLSETLWHDPQTAVSIRCGPQACGIGLR